jgi:hypothetical protein
MLGAVVPFLGLLRPAGAGSLLLSPGSLGTALALARTHTPGTASATRLLANGTLAEAAANQPRFSGSAQHLLVEPQRQNLIRNPRCGGAMAGVVGAGGALPGSGWTVSLAAGLVTEVLGTGTEAGVPYVDLRISGTASGSLYLLLCETIAGPSTSQHSGSAWVRRIGGSLANLAALQIRSGVAGAGGTVAANLPTGAALDSLARYSLSVTPGAGATSMNFGLALNLTSGLSVDLSLRIGGPQLELGPVPSSLILPPAGGPAMATRSADLLTGDAATLFPAGTGTILFSASLARVGSLLHLVQIDNGGDSTRFVLRCTSSGSTELLRTLSGAVATVTLGSLSADTLFRAGIAFDATGRAAASLNGAAAVAVTGGPTGGLAMLRLSNNAGNAAPMQGELGTVVALPQALSDAELAAAVASL